MRRAIIHIGMPRSGTTTFQQILSRRRKSLLECGILYPVLTPRSAANGWHVSHQYLGEALDGRRPAAECRELFDVLDGTMRTTDADTLILSYEGLSQIPPSLEIPGRLQEFLHARGFNVEILATVTTQSAYLNSVYTHRTQFMQEGRGFEAFLSAELPARRYDYGRILEPWTRRALQLHVVPVQDPNDSSPMPYRLLAALGILQRLQHLLTPQVLAMHANRSPGPHAVELSRQMRLARLHLCFGRQARAATRMSEEFFDGLGLDKIAFQAIGAERRRTIESHFAVLNDRLAHRVWGVDWHERVADAAPRPVNELAGTILGADTRTAIQEVGESVCANFGIRRRPGILGWAQELGSGLRSAPAQAARFLRRAGAGRAALPPPPLRLQ